MFGAADEPLATGVVAEPAGAAAETLGDVELAVPFKQPVSPELNEEDEHIKGR